MEASIAVRRILVALDASSQSRAALETAAELAAMHEAELHGVYVEDINLIRLARHPAAREVDPLSATPGPADPRRLERRFKRAAAEAERALAETAARQRVRWAFRVARGAVTSVLLEAAVESDLIALGRAGGGTRGPGRLGSTAREITSRRAQSVLVLQGQLRPGQTVVTLYDGSASCQRAVAAAARLCERLGAELVLIIPAADEQRASQLQTAATEMLADLPVRTRSHTLVGANLDVVLRAVHDERPALCVVGCQTSLGDDLVRRLADQLRVSVYLVK